MKNLFTLLLIVIVFSGFSQSFNNLPVTTQKPPLHGKHWMAITGKPLAATAGAMIFNKGGNAVDASCAMLAATCTMFDVLSWGG
jgi:gamma-glutamyltranspeptidase/glutathione hydrolase